ncbi:MAG: hypothetical protein Q8P24_07800, partial [Desulfobacterales bacterium]|nr:hypothetical protein [Desulfobacterales bacterium]
VVFSTHRNHLDLEDQEFYKNEPIACSPLLAAWLNQELAVKFAVNEGAKCLNILKGNMLSPGSDRDDPVNREAMDLVNVAMKIAAEKYPAAEAWLSFGGGMPEFKEPIKECARYFFKNRIVYWQAPQFKKENYVRVEPGKESPTVQESFQARNHARTLILKGDFAGAYAAVQHLENDEQERNWVNKVHNIARYFMGNLPSTKKAPEINPLLQTNAPRCLLVAMRCEAALQGDRLAEAIAWTCTFFDAALLDFIEKQGWVEKLNDLEKTVTVKHAVDNKFTKWQKGKDRACLNCISENKYSYMTSGAFQQEWVNKLNSNVLKNYLDALNKECDTIRPVDLRNANMHSILNTKLTQKIKQVFNKAQLWATAKEAKERDGVFFLNNKLTKAVLRDLSYPEPAILCKKNIVGKLLKKLDDHEIK